MPAARSDDVGSICERSVSGCDLERDWLNSFARVLNNGLILL